jgi:hypothetical protein
MHQTGYKGITTFSYGIPFDGGLEEWWFTPRENISAFPAIDPLTQYLVSEPILFGGKNWYGPVKVPNDQLGFEEPQEILKAGSIYKQKIFGFYPGENADTRIYTENMAYHEYVIVARVRAGGHFIVLGEKEFGLKFEHDFKTGLGYTATAGSAFSFAMDTTEKAKILLDFLGLNSIPAPGYNPALDPGIINPDGQNDVEVLPFENVAITSFMWTPARVNRFGLLPLIQVWYLEEGNIVVGSTPHISVDAMPPNHTEFIINHTGAATGFVTIK